MQLGEKYKVITESSLCDAKNIRRPLCGRVVYVHPLGRFAVLWRRILSVPRRSLWHEFGR